MKKIIFILLFFVACSGIKEGEVFDKEFVPEHTSMIVMPITISNGKNFLQC